MIATKALDPSLGAEVTGVADPLDDQLISRRPEAPPWHGARKPGEVFGAARRPVTPPAIDTRADHLAGDEALA